MPPKRAPKRSARAAKEPKASAQGAQVPYGANFVRQDVRRRRKTCASKGSGAGAKRLKQMYGGDGRMKRKYTRGDEEITGAPESRRQERAQRHRHQQLAAIAKSSLLKIKSKNEPRSFSSSMTPELLASLSQEDVGVAESRPPDEGDVPLEPLKDTYSPEELNRVLREAFGHESFRPGQMEAVLSVLEMQRTLLLLATGSGKSLCYQLPAYLLREEGLTLVVSPLVSLMADQLARLPKCLRGAVCSGQQSREATREVMRAVRARLVDVLFVSPERLGMWSFDGYGLPKIALACIDEAHCVSEWSHNFRPDYLRLKEYLQGSLQAQRVLALTATATKYTVQSVCEILDLSCVVRSDRRFTVPQLLLEEAQPRVQRSNLRMDVRLVGDEDAQLRELVKIVRNEVDGKDSVLVYVWRKVTADWLAKQLRPYVKGGTSAYHANMLPEVRAAVQANFMSGKVKLVVATVAFGMGIDKPDIRMVVHYGTPYSIENYIQETGRCARDGQAGSCVALVCGKEYKLMRWLLSGGGGGGSKLPLVRKLLVALLRGSSQYPRHTMSKDAFLQAGGRPEDLDQGWEAYCLSFDEKLTARDMNCSNDELHSVLAHLCRYGHEHVALLSSFPTKLKLRFFRSDPQELAQQDALLQKVLPLAKKVGPVYTVDTAKALALMGGTAGQLSNGLWQARGDEFSVEKAEYGYMVSVLRPVSDELLEDWAAQISSINVRARESNVEKLDACYIALSKASEASGASDGCLNGLVDAYFAATAQPCDVVAGGGEEKRRRLEEALGYEYRLHSQARPRAPQALASLGQVRAVVARLLMDPAWPEMPCDEIEVLVHAVAQFLAGVGSEVMPARKWQSHHFWGRFRGCGDFQTVEEQVREAVLASLPQVQKHKRLRLHEA